MPCNHRLDGLVIKTPSPIELSENIVNSFFLMRVGSPSLSTRSCSGLSTGVGSLLDLSKMTVSTEAFMEDREYTVIDIIRDPRPWVYEAMELTRTGHHYIYRFDALEEIFTRATVPAGAASTHFRPLGVHDKLPFGGWRVVEKRTLPKSPLRLIDVREPLGEAAGKGSNL